MIFHTCVRPSSGEAIGIKPLRRLPAGQLQRATSCHRFFAEAVFGLVDMVGQSFPPLFLLQ
jgi:hypothetical protein